MTALRAKKPLTIDEYELLIRRGELTPDDRLELIEGELVEKMTINPPHASCVNLLNELLVFAVARRAVVQVQNPVAVPPASMPEPDLSIVARDVGFDGTKRPWPPDVLLVIEVGDSTTRRDRRRKIPLYAKAGIQEVWLVDLVDRVVERYRSPGAEGFGDVVRLEPGATISPLALPDISIAVSEIIGS